MRIRSQNIPIFRQYASVHKKPEILYITVLRSDKYFQQIGRTQSKHTKIVAFLYTNKTTLKQKSVKQSHSQ